MVMVNVKGIGISEKDSYEFKSKDSSNSKNTSFEDVLKVKSLQNNDDTKNVNQKDTDSDNESDNDRYSNRNLSSDKTSKSDKTSTASNKHSNVSEANDADEKEIKKIVSKLNGDLEDLLKDIKDGKTDMSLIQQMLEMLIKGNGACSDDELKKAMKALGISDEVQDKLMKVMHDIKELLKNNSGKDLLKTLDSALSGTDNSSLAEKEKLIRDIIDSLKKKLNGSDALNSSSSKFDNDFEDKGTLDQAGSSVLGSNKENTKASYDSDSTNEQAKSGDSSENFLKNLISKDDNTESQFSKVTAFMNQFSSSAVEVQGDAKVMTANRVTFVEDMIKSVKFMENNNIKELTVKINPKELGEVIIKLTSEAGVMKAELTTSNKDAYNLLNSNLNEMNKNLNEQNIKIQAFSVNVYNDDTTFFSGQDKESNEKNKENQKNNSNKNIKIDTESDDAINNSSDNSSLNKLNMLA
ncbi:flagellar hook-length control protein FliK [Clostridium acetobutylicum]|uniref:Flagellar hook-length control protein fliK n=2 Tax=Clostridium acetobutylicum TaxID=1488 RepID=Q97H56_CLOAB|nr:MULTISPECIES: flagellar hook-length control protein FliK [Clostridium]AAK80115.1 Flagellar hook-length control protein fliK [Clostridium acetobutylicum ATCC 824]AEI32204.1 flagellar hook-length control protein fliK [Clostridium acetobutylicum DSM 1731]AWV79460.1 flagellar hook-length control protein FliK [Clostridium acetobutylicum]MBC2394569.1 flagellar hook-length control protein FliK [Clostridium acetobutylicum]MBC2583531.1 flagellar hook-length control protein FliK [Clostridium acetobut